MPPVSMLWGMEQYLFIDLYSLLQEREASTLSVISSSIPLLGDCGTKVGLELESKYIWTAEREYSEICSTVQMKLHKKQHLYMFGGFFLRLKSQ